ncbi:hypothetical protein COCC4DRAFT_138227 [Bipolaris maydis ATCC 48331]|uniref:Uncharacterized protein n=2 Tax=Cochliobolus heterostrophus TaxID=5016 RepID=M2SV92_COCH5|nr:uncharacterized protein COCC4DRAFT_138227 [Bipolaris maydis ATCC 48331]EMD89280.1 hypothetical protein COCHEDRAFT_1108663 [Bipolaris maydis C5]KAJ5024930.1 hypothetical protein J3E73DRAFT_323812 [Bipolaris maydis]ENI05003.1 hypothetical protein COCC4DRAFT_138227 [Bipolaris maydis ATCC 48331]KAJ5057149.1 hypothetical protein J3E74DRAFT_370054 [Bipolaris maydis]KAJ6194321.1 hypothetical protein J3E72DRAFT_347642 [Bipolaris maydis]
MLKHINCFSNFKSFYIAVLLLSIPTHLLVARGRWQQCHMFARTPLLHKFPRQVTVQRISQAPQRPSQQTHSTLIVQNSFLDSHISRTPCDIPTSLECIMNAARAAKRILLGHTL